MTHFVDIFSWIAIIFAVSSAVLVGSVIIMWLTYLFIWAAKQLSSLIKGLESQGRVK